jgi:hypothetical protein
MRILRVIVAVAVLFFVAVQLGPGARAAGPVSEVLIGELLPLTGTSRASASSTSGPGRPWRTSSTTTTRI